MKLVVLGMHRSGTSLASGLLNLAGIYFGEEHELIPVNSENPRGFWERKDIRALNDKLLHSMACDWSEISDLYKRGIPAEVMSQFEHEASSILHQLEDKSQSGICAIKEPRLCLLMPSWQRILGEDCFYLIVHREPEEIAISLFNRNKIPFDVSSYLTRLYLGRAIASIGENPFHIVSFRELIEEPVNSTNRIIDALNEAGQNLPYPKEKKLIEFATPVLYRSKLKNENISIGRQLKSWHESLRNKQLPRVKSFRNLAPKAVLEYQHRKRFFEYAKTTTELEYRTKRVSTLESQIIPNRKLTDKLEVLTGNISGITAKYTDKADELAQSKTLLESAKADLDIAQSRLDQTRIELDQAKSENDLQASQLAEALDNLNQSQLQLKTQSSALQESGEQLKVQSGEIERLVAEFREKEKELAKADTRLEEKSSALQESGEQLKVQSGEIERLVAVFREKEKELAVSGVELDKRDDEIADINSRLEKSREQLQLAADSLKQKDSILSETRSNFDFQGKELSETKIHLEETRHTLRALKRNIKKLNKACDFQRQEIKTRDHHVGELLARSSEHQIRIDRLLEQQQSLQQELLKRDQELLISLSEQRTLQSQIFQLSNALTDAHDETGTTRGELQKTRAIVEKVTSDSKELYELSDSSFPPGIRSHHID